MNELQNSKICNQMVTVANTDLIKKKGTIRTKLASFFSLFNGAMGEFLTFFFSFLNYVIQDSILLSNLPHIPSLVLLQYILPVNPFTTNFLSPIEEKKGLTGKKIELSAIRTNKNW